MIENGRLKLRLRLGIFIFLLAVSFQSQVRLVGNVANNYYNGESAANPVVSTPYSITSASHPKINQSRLERNRGYYRKGISQIPRNSTITGDWQREAKKEVLLEPLMIYDGVVQVSKVHSPRESIYQMLCLNKAAYNHRRNYPWVIFTTIPLSDQQQRKARAIAAPANVTFVQDSPPLQEVLVKMSPGEREQLIHRCQCCNEDNTKCCEHPETLADWDFWCKEGDGTQTVTLSYAWQAQFRAYHLWKHPVLADYKYMIWMDDDAIPTKSWLKDPMKAMVEENLIVFYDNFPQGSVRNRLVIEKMELAYNKSLCYINQSGMGKFITRMCKPDNDGHKLLESSSAFGLVHGFMHITDLEVYRKPIHLNFNRILTTYKTFPFSRQWDDQIAVTVPAAMEDPDRAWDMRLHGYNMSILHNGMLDGKTRAPKFLFTRWWNLYKDTWPVAREMCNNLVKFGG